MKTIKHLNIVIILLLTLITTALIQNHSMAASVLSVTAPNSAPIADDQIVNTVQGQDKDITLSGSDADDDTLTFVLVTGPTNGALGTSDVTGRALTYTPNAGFVGTDSFTIKANDGALDSALATITINVTETAPPNAAPIANAQTFNTVKEQGTSVPLFSSDADEDPLTIEIVTRPANGELQTVDVTRRGYYYLPNLGFVGTDSFTFKVNDGKVDSAIATITINVTETAAPNSAPIANDQIINVVQGQEKNIRPSSSDADDDTLTFELVTGPTNGNLVSPFLIDFFYTPNPGFVGTDSFTFKMNDGKVDSAVATITINVTETAAPSAAPIADDQIVNTIQGQDKDISLTGSDADEDTLTFELVTVPTNGEIGTSDVTGRALTYTPNAGFVGADSFTIKANDGALDSPIATITINVTETAPPNVAPIANDQTFNTVKEQNVHTPFSSSDADGDTLTTEIVTTPTNGALNMLSGHGLSYTYTPNPGFVGTDSFTFKVNDGKVDSAIATITINVAETAAPNSAPIANDQIVNTAQGQNKDFTLSGSDADDDALTFEFVTTPANGNLATIDVTGRGFFYAPNADFVGTDSLTFKVNDGKVDSAIATITINVTDEAMPNATAGNDQLFLPFVTR